MVDREMIPLDELTAPVTTSPEDERAVCLFLRTFSRFEHALKRCGHAEMAGGGNKKITVKWREWAGNEKIVASFQPGSEFWLEVQLLLEKPPAREVLDECKQPKFEEETPVARTDANLKWLLEMTYRIRNNLFHGAKWPLDPARDPPLLMAGMAVLRKCLVLDKDLKRAYETLS